MSNKPKKDVILSEVVERVDKTCSLPLAPTNYVSDVELFHDSMPEVPLQLYRNAISDL